MKKLILFMVMLAVTMGSGVASADRVYVPWILHYGTADYTDIHVTNLSTAAVKITVLFTGTTLESGSSSMNTNTFTSTTSVTTTLAGGNTWRVLTQEGALFSSTTSLKRAVISILSSADPEPDVGPIGAWAFYVHLEGSAPSGFMFPLGYRIKSAPTWTSVGGGTVGISANDWRQ